MSTDRDPLPPIPLRAAAEPAGDRMPRRVALQALLGGVGAGLALPLTAEAQHPINQHLAHPAAIQQAQQDAAIPGGTTLFVDEHQMKTLTSLAEAIVPGSTNARVAPFLDQLLAVESPANQRAFVGALGAFDMAATSKHTRTWLALTPAEQDALLRESSTADLKTSAMRGQFQNLKDWIVGAYYSSEVGMRELGWNGEVIHGQLPGCTHPGGHLA